MEAPIVVDATTIAFRLTTIAVLATIAVALLKLIGAVKVKAQFEEKVKIHMEQSEPLIPQFHAMQTAITVAETRHNELTQKLGRFIETQETANNGFRESINILIKNRIGGG